MDQLRQALRSVGMKSSLEPELDGKCYYSFSISLNEEVTSKDISKIVELQLKKLLNALRLAEFPYLEFHLRNMVIASARGCVYCYGSGCVECGPHTEDKLYDVRPQQHGVLYVNYEWSRQWGQLPDKLDINPVVGRELQTAAMSEYGLSFSVTLKQLNFEQFQRSKHNRN